MLKSDLNSSFLDTQVSLAPTHVSKSVSPLVAHTFGFPISGRPSVQQSSLRTVIVDKKFSSTICISKSVFPNVYLFLSVFFQSVFIRSVFLRNVPDLRVF